MKYLLALALAAVPLTAAADTVRQACLKGRAETRIAIDLTKDSVLNCQCHYIKQQATVTPNPVFLRGFALCILKFYDVVLYRFLSYSVPFFSM